MAFRFFSLIALTCLSAALHAQTERPFHYQLYGGYTFLSNSPDGVPGAHQPLNGWDGSLGFFPWHGLRFKLETYGYRGTNLSASQNVYYILGGGQYNRRVGREWIFAEALFGDAGINRYWGPSQLAGDTASFTYLFGGGLDTPINRRFSFRAVADYQWTNFSLVNLTTQIPYTYPGLPSNFARISSGLVWQF